MSECVFFDEEEQENLVNKQCRDHGALWYYVYSMNSMIWLVLLLALTSLEVSITCFKHCHGLQLVSSVASMLIVFSCQFSHLFMIACTIFFNQKPFAKLCAMSNRGTYYDPESDSERARYAGLTDESTYKTDAQMMQTITLCQSILLPLICIVVPTSWPLLKQNQRLCGEAGKGPDMHV